MNKKIINYRAFINACHHYFAKSPRLVRIFVLIRNQCYPIISYYLANSSDFFKNGESLMIDFLAKECVIVVDVGANKGMWTEYFLNKNSFIQIFLFEPSINAFSVLKTKFNTTNNVTLINKGLADKKSQNIFFEEPECGETSSLVPGVSNNHSKQIHVELTTVDLIMEEYGLTKIDYLKIDVEGYDLFVLKGAEENLKSKKIKFVQFEYNSSWTMAGSTLIQAFMLFGKYGYKTFLLRWDGLYEFNYALYGEYYSYSNFFALPEESVAIIKPLIKGTI